MKKTWSRGTHGNNGNRQVHPLRIPAGCAKTSILAFGASEGPKSCRLAQSDLFSKFPENQKWGAEIFLVILGEPKIPERVEPVRAGLLPWRALQGSRSQNNAKPAPIRGAAKFAGCGRRNINLEKVESRFRFLCMLVRTSSAASKR